MVTFYLIIVIFLILLAVVGLYVGVSNDAVNFLSSAVGTKAASTRWIIFIAAAGVLCGASINNGMMDIARNGVFHPEFFYGSELMCIFMAVMFANLILLDIFIMMGMPTSTTVAMVFELLGGTVAIAALKSASGDMAGAGSMADLINTDKAFAMILGIFLSVAIAFIFGVIVQYLTRLFFTFNFNKNAIYKMGLFGGLCSTALIYFMVIKGVGNAPFLSPDVKLWISQNTMTIVLVSFAFMTTLMQALHMIGVNVLKVIVLMGTFALAMAFAGNDLVNFIGVPLAGYEAFQDFSANATNGVDTYLMGSLNESSSTPVVFLIIAGGIMVFSLATSKKTKHILKTSLNLSRQDTGDEMFGSSVMARTVVRNLTQAGGGISDITPGKVRDWVNSRFDKKQSIMDKDAAFDLVRGSINLVLAGMLISFGTSLQLPLSTTFVAFMVSMGTSLADRAWGRDSAVYRVTGVFSVIGGWLFTAVFAFALAFFIALFINFGGIVAIIIMLAISAFLLYRDNVREKKAKEDTGGVFKEMMTTTDGDRLMQLLLEHNKESVIGILDYTSDAFSKVVDGFLDENIRLLKKTLSKAVEEKSTMKILKRKEILAMRRLDKATSVKKNTWFHLSYNCCEQMLYSIRRICDPCKEHVDNAFSPLDKKYKDEILYIKGLVLEAAQLTHDAIINGPYDNLEPIRDKIKSKKDIILNIRREQVARVSGNSEENIETSTLYLSIIQEAEEIITEMRHLVRDIGKLQE